MADRIDGPVYRAALARYGISAETGETVVELRFRDPFRSQEAGTATIVIPVSTAKIMASELGDVLGRVCRHRLARKSGRRPIARNARVAVLDPLEERAISLLGTRWSNRENMVVRGIRRKSGRQFDLGLDGEYGPPARPYNFSGWLPLMVIGEVRWTAPKYARLSCCPEMTAAGDWSGIRDSEEDAIWAMFELAREELGI